MYYVIYIMYLNVHIPYNHTQVLYILWIMHDCRYLGVSHWQYKSPGLHAVAIRMRTSTKHFMQRHGEYIKQT